MLTKKMPLQLVKELKLEDESKFGVKAASGLVQSGGSFFVIADDELSLFQFDLVDPFFINTFPLKSGSLPADPKERKRQKPDWEALIKLELKNHPDILLAVPSGSTENRMMGAYVLTDSQGLIDKNQKAVEVDFSKIYSALKERLPELNIEGACVLNNTLKLFQRGNGASGVNAMIDIELDGFCKDLEKRVAIDPKYILHIEKYDLGELRGFKLDFTDVYALNNKIWFLAAAEASASTYHDGLFHGAILGCLDIHGKEIERYEIDCEEKPEGLWIENLGSKLCFYIVTDADSPTKFASMWRGLI